MSTMQTKPSTMTAPDRIRAWVERAFAAKYVARVTEDLVDVATGNRPGNRYERAAVRLIFKERSQSR